MGRLTSNESRSGFRRHKKGGVLDSSELLRADPLGEVELPPCRGPGSLSILSGIETMDEKAQLGTLVEHEAQL